MRQFAALPPNERWSLAVAVGALLAARLVLRVVPFRVLRRAAVWKLPTASILRALAADRLVWAVEAAGRRMPGASCLARALALQFLMKSAGHECRLRIGVGKDGGGRFQSHAWLEHEGKVLLGDIGDLEKYAPIPAMLEQIG